MGEQLPDKVKKIKEIIENGGVLYYNKDKEKDKGFLLNPSFKENTIFGSKELTSYWYNEGKEKIQLGKFLDLEEIKIRKEKNRAL